MFGYDGRDVPIPEVDGKAVILIRDEDDEPVIKGHYRGRSPEWAQATSPSENSEGGNRVAWLWPLLIVIIVLGGVALCSV